MPRRAKRPMPPTAPTGQPYGDRGEQIAAQQAVPMGPPPDAAGPPAARQAMDPMAAAQAMTMPTPISAPSERPNEPITAGLPIGPGLGPEAVPMMPKMRRGQISQTLELLADASGDPGYSELAALAQREGK